MGKKRAKKFDENGIAFQKYNGYDLYYSGGSLPPFIYSTSLWEKFGYRVKKGAKIFAYVQKYNQPHYDRDHKYPVYEFGEVEPLSGHPLTLARRIAFLDFLAAYQNNDRRWLYKMAFSTKRFRLTKYVIYDIKKKLSYIKAHEIKARHDVMYMLFSFHLDDFYKEKTPRYMLTGLRDRRVVPDFLGWSSYKRLNKWTANLHRIKRNVQLGLWQ